MAKRTDPPQASDEQVRALLERYKCPVPFHEVRTRFLGNIATPDMSASPMRVFSEEEAFTPITPSGPRKKAS